MRNMPETVRKSAVLWTGGKDSALALHEARAAGWVVDRLVTFAPPNPDFLAHPIAVMAAQARAIGLPHQLVEIAGDAREGYRAAIDRMRTHDGIGALVTGDIDLVDGLPNFVGECCRGLDVQVVTPLWGRARLELMNKLIDLGFEAVMSLVKRPWFTPQWVGRRIDAACLRDMQALGDSCGLDLCGENGEYHTVVLNGPIFRHGLSLDLGPPKEVGQMMHINVMGVHPVAMDR
jgi:diphthine-ammonia ligase